MFLNLLFKLDDLQETNKALKDDFHIVRNTVQTLDKEKDRLCAEIDIKSDENLHLNQELNAKHSSKILILNEKKSFSIRILDELKKISNKNSKK